MKKIGLTLLLLIVVLSSCSTTDQNLEKNKILVEKYVTAVENMDTATMELLLADNYEGFGPSVNDNIDKKGAIESWKENVENLYESIHYSKSRVIAVNVPDGENKGEWVSNWAELKIVYKKDKKEVIIWANTIYQIEKNMIVKSYTFYNEADVLEQLGYVFINPNNL
ncbi:MAG: hypothetical protein DRJ07_08510 [Bacteroidetes bacterium]|nr:MAG: hypothetical protein DRJ07_08510 [Bacteroidota bacterium]